MIECVLVYEGALLYCLMIANMETHRLFRNQIYAQSHEINETMANHQIWH